MDVKVKDEDSSRTAFLLRIFCRYCQIVQQAESRSKVSVGMVCPASQDADQPAATFAAPVFLARHGYSGHCPGYFSKGPRDQCLGPPKADPPDLLLAQLISRPLANQPFKIPAVVDCTYCVVNGRGVWLEARLDELYPCCQRCTGIDVVLCMKELAHDKPVLLVPAWCNMRRSNGWAEHPNITSK